MLLKASLKITDALILSKKLVLNTEASTLNLVLPSVKDLPK